MRKSDIKVLLVEDDGDLRESMIEWLELAGLDVHAVSSAAEFYRVLTDNDFQVAVIDLGLPDQSGYVLTEYARSNTGMAVIILTARGTVDDKIRGYDSGADLYLVKPVDCRELSAAISSIAQRMEKRSAQMPVLQKLWSISTSQWKLGIAGDVQISLSEKELKFLRLLAATPGQPVLRNTLLTELYQWDNHHTQRSLDSLVRRLRGKVMSKAGVVIPVRTVHAVGYCFTDAISVY